MSSKVIVATFALLLSAFFSTTAAAATTPPTVAFVGDWLTDGWSVTFPANWINDGDCCNSGSYTPQQIAAAIAQKPSLIHIMIGSAYWDDDAGYNLVTALLQEDLSQMILQVQAAGIPLIIGIEPSQFTGPEGIQEADIEVYAVATKYGVPIINYNGAFGSATSQVPGTQITNSGYGGTTQGGTAQGFSWASGGLIIPTNTSTKGFNEYSPAAPSPAGYAIMTMTAQTAFATLNAQPKSVYLQDELQASEQGPAVSNVNTVSPGNTVQFYPVVSYTNGVTGAYLNSNFLTGSNGTWTSSNPLVGFVNQSGQFWAFNEGTTIVKFTLPNGVWNEWIMYVGAPFAG